MQRSKSTGGHYTEKEIFAPVKLTIKDLNRNQDKKPNYFREAGLAVLDRQSRILEDKGLVKPREELKDGQQVFSDVREGIDKLKHRLQKYQSLQISNQLDIEQRKVLQKRKADSQEYKGKVFKVSKSQAALVRNLRSLNASPADRLTTELLKPFN